MIGTALTALALLGIAAVPAATDEPDTRDTFFARLSALCGEAFEGYSNFPEDGPFAGKLLRAEIAECGENEIRIPFAVGEDRSRTWIVSRGDRGLLLKHDHRREDGKPDEITMYGGWATVQGSGRAQSFEADDHTRELIPDAATNVWTLELGPEGDELAYSLDRHGKPRFRATLERKASGAADRVNPAFEPLEWLVGEWQASFRPGGEGQAAPTMTFAWGDDNRSFLRMSGTRPTPHAGLEPEYESIVVWHPVRQRFVFLGVYRSAAGKVTEDGDIDILEGGAVRLNMSVRYPPGASLPFTDGATAGPDGETLEFRRTFFRDDSDGLRGRFRIRRDGAWIDPLPEMAMADGFPWRRVEAWAAPVEIRLAKGTDDEARAKVQLERILSEFDIEHWLYTREVVIDEAEPIPHSHPVLTLNSDALDDDHAQLSIFLHEQFHWFRSGRMHALDAALADFRELFPEVPSGRGGARDEASTYLHLVICDLELQALSKLVGEAEARRVISGWSHYAWIYEQVLENPEVRAINERHGLLVPEPGEEDAAVSTTR